MKKNKNACGINISKEPEFRTFRLALADIIFPKRPSDKQELHIKVLCWDLYKVSPVNPNYKKMLEEIFDYAINECDGIIL